jgi:hypothetical protein
VSELRLIVDELFDALEEGDLDGMLAALERLDGWRERDRRRRRLLRRRNGART